MKELDKLIRKYIDGRLTVDFKELADLLNSKIIGEFVEASIESDEPLTLIDNIKDINDILSLIREFSEGKSFKIKSEEKTIEFTEDYIEYVEFEQKESYKSCILNIITKNGNIEIELLDYIIFAHPLSIDEAIEIKKIIKEIGEIEESLNKMFSSMSSITTSIGLGLGLSGSLFKQEDDREDKLKSNKLEKLIAANKHLSDEVRLLFEIWGQYVTITRYYWKVL